MIAAGLSALKISKYCYPAYLSAFRLDDAMEILTALEHHKAGRIAEAVEIYQQILQADPDHPEALHLMGNAAAQLGDIDFSIALISKASLLFPRNTTYLLSLGMAYRTKKLFDQAMACYSGILEIEPNSASAYFGMGITLQKQDRMDEAMQSFRQALALAPDFFEARYALANLEKSAGRHAEAIANYRLVVAQQPGFADAHHDMGDAAMASQRLDEAADHYAKAISISPGMAQTHFNLGVVRYRQNDLTAAASCFEQAVLCRPDYPEAVYNLGLIHGRHSRPAEAERCYRQVLDLDPDYIDAHINLAVILDDDGRVVEAKRHAALAYSRRNLFEKYSPDANKTVLILFDAGKGNLNLTHLFNEKKNNIIDWMIEYAPAGQADRLPAYDLVFNAMGDADVTGDVAAPLSRFVQVCARPLLNHPDKVARTARDKLPALLAGIDGLCLPPVRRYADRAGWDASLADRLPLLIRPVHTQGGIGLTLATDAAELAQCRAGQSGPVYVSQFVDYRSADSWCRKYRMIFIDRKPYPYHLAISPNWMVHYYTAEMEACPWKLEEESRFLQDPQAVLGPAGMQAIAAIGAKMDLDYAGIDFSILPDGRILVFEANPTMLAHPENAAGVLQHKNVYIQRILDAFEDLLTRAVEPPSHPSL
jgi:tetratricopeptide (TPR) repeat protein